MLAAPEQDLLSSLETASSSLPCWVAFASSSETCPWKSALTSRTRCGLPPNPLVECSMAL